jgi:hypothetical protein
MRRVSCVDASGQRQMEVALDWIESDPAPMTSVAFVRIFCTEAIDFCDGGIKILPPKGKGRG